MRSIARGTSPEGIRAERQLDRAGWRGRMRGKSQRMPYAG
jgi:hypothetical protein